MHRRLEIFGKRLLKVCLRDGEFAFEEVWVLISFRRFIQRQVLVVDIRVHHPPIRHFGRLINRVYLPPIIVKNLLLSTIIHLRFLILPPLASFSLLDIIIGSVQLIPIIVTIRYSHSFSHRDFSSCYVLQDERLQWLAIDVRIRNSNG